MPMYATGTDVTSRYDVRRLSQFLSDSGTPVCTPTQIQNGTCAATILPTNTNLLNLISDASNKILMSCRVANRYLQSDLDAIYLSRYLPGTTTPQTDSSKDRSPSLIRLCCDLTFAYVMERRGLGVREISSLAPGYRDALETLDQIKNGYTVFDDSPPDGTDAPSSGASVNVVSAPSGNSQSANCEVLWTTQVAPIFPGPNSGYGGGGRGGGYYG